MNCATFRKQFSVFQDNRLSSDQMNDMALHLQSCADCRKFTEASEAVWELLTILPKPKLPPFFYTRLKARMEADHQAKPLSWIQRAVLSAMVTAVLTLGIILGSMAGRFSRAAKSENDLFYGLPLEEINVLSESAYASDYFEFFSQEGGAE
ncbi:zf-HC2 domain-containing protein [bacterium]|nr:zf-HC2 domain-containing protein [bacterium]